MRRIYNSKVDTWLVVALFVFVVCPIVPVMMVDFSWIPIVMALVILAFALYFMLSISYVITDSTLFVKCGVLYKCKYQIKNIHKIQDTNSILSAPAASMKRIAIYFYGDATPLIISPRNKEDFIKTLTEINPSIRYTT